MHAHMNRAALILLALMIPVLLVVPGASLAAAESVTGHADFVTATGFRFSYSFSAIRHADGSVSGQFENHVENAQTGEFLLKAHVRIMFFTVVDNGEGDAASPDLASPPALGLALPHCETGLPRPLFPITRGNIQVRP